MESSQPALFHERFEDALDETVRALGGRKAVAGMLFPDKSPRDAHNLVDACLNPDRRERFTPGQVLFLMRLGGQANPPSHAGMQFLARELGYEIRPVAPAEQRDRVLDVVESATSTLAAALAQLERLAGRATVPPGQTLRHVRGAGG